MRLLQHDKIECQQKTYALVPVTTNQECILYMKNQTTKHQVRTCMLMLRDKYIKYTHSLVIAFMFT